MIWHPKLSTIALTTILASALVGQAPSFRSGTTEVRFPYAVPEGSSCPAKEELALKVDGSPTEITDSVPITDGPVALGFVLEAICKDSDCERRQIKDSLAAVAKLTVAGDACRVWNGAKRDESVDDKFAESGKDSGTKRCLEFLQRFDDLLTNHWLGSAMLTGIYSNVWDIAMQARGNLSSFQASRKMLIVFGSGLDWSSPTKPKSVARPSRSIRDAKVMIVFFDSTGVWLMPEVAKQGKKDVNNAAAAGGIVVSPEEFLDRFEKELQKSRRQCAVTFLAPDRPDRKKISIALTSRTGTPLAYRPYALVGKGEH